MLSPLSEGGSVTEVSSTRSIAVVSPKLVPDHDAAVTSTRSETELPNLLPLRCSVCAAPCNYVCNNCESVAYCNTTCQLNDWPVHKTHCRHVKHAIESVRSGAVSSGSLRSRLGLFRSKRASAPESPVEKRDKEMQEALAAWKDILGNWDAKKDRQSTRELWLRTVPPSVRGPLWVRAVSNELAITEELFKILVAQSLPTAVDGRALGNAETAMQIPQDLPRTFPALNVFKPGGPLHGALRDVLHAYVCFRPDVGYVQGMSYLVSVLLLNMSPFEGFLCLANAINAPLLRCFYSMQADRIESYFSCLESLISQYLPKLHRHFKTTGIAVNMFALDWILTLFSKALPLDAAARVWDLFFLDGEPAVFRTALGLLRCLAERLLLLDFDGCLVLLNNLPELDGAELMRHILKIPLGARKYAQALAGADAPPASVATRSSM